MNQAPKFNRVCVGNSNASIIKCLKNNNTQNEKLQLNAASFITSDKSLKLNYPSVSYTGLEISCRTAGNGRHGIFVSGNDANAGVALGTSAKKLTHCFQDYLYG